MRVDLIYFTGCPHVQAARANLREALTRHGEAPAWTEWDTSVETTPVAYRAYASPTVLVNGVDVEPKPASAGGSCAMRGAPGVERLLAALRGAARPSGAAAHR